MHYTHVSDVVQGIILAMESDAAPGEAFNILGPEATPRALAVKYIAEKTGQKYYEAHLDTMWDFECSIEKARRLLGYAPRFTTKMMIDDALAWRDKGVFTIHKLNSAEF
jgi:nucleoside-diphosphate-sugar epimerase